MGRQYEVYDGHTDTDKTIYVFDFDSFIQGVYFVWRSGGVHYMRINNNNWAVFADWPDLFEKLAKSTSMIMTPHEVVEILESCGFIRGN